MLVSQLEYSLAAYEPPFPLRPSNVSMHQAKYVPVAIPAVLDATVVKAKEALSAPLKSLFHHAGDASIYTEAVSFGGEIDNQQVWACPRGGIAQRNKRTQRTRRQQLFIFIMRCLTINHHQRNESVTDSLRSKKGTQNIPQTLNVPCSPAWLANPAQRKNLRAAANQEQRCLAKWRWRLHRACFCQ